ncbi:hypothetical protein FPCIR_10165 [Fusarium pseudocircinatum]|uniref:Uncharacterized protein n=1 Tax=Fusarium pseudocircinatum TaxID=56676 RepID=A0A8H5NW19_9HYPO|nr:hypothetical protein FPCIR_10165 [Fusarium pseudocircinatum]
MDLVDGSFDPTFVKWVKTTETALAEARGKKDQLVTDPYDRPSNTVHTTTPPLRWILLTVGSFDLTFVKWVKTTETAQIKKGQLVTDHPAKDTVNQSS